HAGTVPQQRPDRVLQEQVVLDVPAAARLQPVAAGVGDDVVLHHRVLGRLPQVDIVRVLVGRRAADLLVPPVVVEQVPLDGDPVHRARVQPLALDAGVVGVGDDVAADLDVLRV